MQGNNNRLATYKDNRMKDFVKVKQLEDVVTQMNSIFKNLTDRLEKLEAEAAKPAPRSSAKKEEK